MAEEDSEAEDEAVVVAEVVVGMVETEIATEAIGLMIVTEIDIVVVIETEEVAAIDIKEMTDETTVTEAKETKGQEKDETVVEMTDTDMMIVVTIADVTTIGVMIGVVIEIS